MFHPCYFINKHSYFYLVICLVTSFLSIFHILSLCSFSLPNFNSSLHFIIEWHYFFNLDSFIIYFKVIILKFDNNIFFIYVKSRLIILKLLQHNYYNFVLNFSVNRFTYDITDFNPLDLIAQLESDFPQSVLPAGPA